MRDLGQNPYTKDEQRVAGWICANTPMGGGDDPIGFLLASYSFMAQERNEARRAEGLELSPIHKANGFWYFQDDLGDRCGAYATWLEAEIAYSRYLKAEHLWFEPWKHCATCYKPLSKIGTFRKVPQWLCTECGWVSIGEGDTRWA